MRRFLIVFLLLLLTISADDSHAFHRRIRGLAHDDSMPASNINEPLSDVTTTAPNTKDSSATPITNQGVSDTHYIFAMLSVFAVFCSIILLSISFNGIYYMWFESTETETIQPSYANESEREQYNPCGNNACCKCCTTSCDFVWSRNTDTGVTNVVKWDVFLTGTVLLLALEIMFTGATIYSGYLERSVCDDYIVPVTPEYGYQLVRKHTNCDTRFTTFTIFSVMWNRNLQVMAFVYMCWYIIQHTCYIVNSDFSVSLKEWSGLMLLRVLLISLSFATFIGWLLVGRRQYFEELEEFTESGKWMGIYYLTYTNIIILLYSIVDVMVNSCCTNRFPLQYYHWWIPMSFMNIIMLKDGIRYFLPLEYTGLPGTTDEVFKTITLHQTNTPGMYRYKFIPKYDLYDATKYHASTFTNYPPTLTARLYDTYEYFSWTAAGSLTNWGEGTFVPILMWVVVFGGVGAFGYVCMTFLSNACQNCRSQEEPTAETNTQRVFLTTVENLNVDTPPLSSV